MDLNEDRKAELKNVIENITKDTHNEAIGECHGLVLVLVDGTEGYIKDLFSELEKKIVKLYKK